MHQISKQGDRLHTRVERGIFKRTTRIAETRYEVSYTDSDGYQWWRTVATLTEARRLRAGLVTRVASGERVALSKVTLEEFATEWLAQQRTRLRPTTLRLYRSYLAQHVYPRLGERKLSTITVDDIAALIADMEQGWRYRDRNGLVRVKGKPFAGWTIRRVLVVLGRVLGRAARTGIINANPASRLEREERPKAERRCSSTMAIRVRASAIPCRRWGAIGSRMFLPRPAKRISRRMSISTRSHGQRARAARKFMGRSHRENFWKHWAFANAPRHWRKPRAQNWPPSIA